MDVGYNLLLSPCIFGQVNTMADGSICRQPILNNVPLFQELITSQLTKNADIATTKGYIPMESQEECVDVKGDPNKEEPVVKVMEEAVIDHKIYVGALKEEFKEDCKIGNQENVKVNSEAAKVETKMQTSEKPDHVNYHDTNQVMVPTMKPVEANHDQVRQIPEAYEQIGREIQAKLEQKAPMEFKLQLQPKELGVIDIKMKLSNGKLVIDIMAASEKTQSLLTSQVDKLVQSMGLQNVQVESIKIDQPTYLQGHEQQNAFLMNAGMGFSQKRQQGEANHQVGSSRKFVSLDVKNDEKNESAGKHYLNNNKLDYKV